MKDRSPRRLARALALVVMPVTIAASPLLRTLGAQGADSAATWDLFASARVRAEAWDWFDDSERGQYSFLGALVRLGVQRMGPRTGWRLEMAAPLLAALPDDAVIPAPTGGFGPGAGQLGLGGTYYAVNFDEQSAAQFFPKQAYWRMTRHELRTTRTLRVGRFEYDDGTEIDPPNATLSAVKRDRVMSRVLGAFKFSHVGRSFDGAHFSQKRDGRDITVIVAAPTRGVFQADGWAPLPIGVGYGAWTVPYSTTSGSAEARLFGLQYTDLRGDDVVKTDNRALAARQADDDAVSVTSLGGHWMWALDARPATFDVLLWGVGQVGSWGDQSHRAYSGVAEAGLQPKGLESVNPWIRLGYAYGSGDDDPDDDTHGTFFQVLPTPRPYARFPFYDMQNTSDAYGIVALRPSPKLTLRGEVHSLRLSRGEDLWYSGGGAFQQRSFGYQGRPTGGERELSTLVDISADLRVTPDFIVSLYLAQASAGDAMRTSYPQNGPGTLVFLEVNRTF